jgi:dethiobiotin synthetase
MGYITSSSMAFFVTGTDTEVGKTLVSKSLLSLLSAKGHVTAGYKPISAGCEFTSAGLRNEDALQLQSNSSLSLEYDEVNPVAFEAPIAPHIAIKALAKENEPQYISLDRVREGFMHLLQKDPDILVVEGAGGWRLPLGVDFQNQPRYLSEFVVEQNLSVILVVGMRLGCLNHAVLTSESIRNDGLKVAAWVANEIDPDMPELEANIDSLKTLLEAPFLGSIPRLRASEDCAAYLDLSVLGLA